MREGQPSVQTPQPVHFVASTYLAFFLIFTVKLPTNPFTDSTADGRQLFDDVNVVSRVGNIKSRLDACDTAADDQRALCDGAFACGQGRVELHLGNCGAGKDYRLCRSLGLVFMYP